MKVTVIEVDDIKQQRALFWRDVKMNRRLAKLKRLIAEVRQLRAIAKAKSK